MKRVDIFLRKIRIKRVKEFITKGSIVLDIGAYDGALFKNLRDRIKFGIGIEPLLKDEIIRRKNYILFKGEFPSVNIDYNRYKINIVTMMAVLEHISPDIQEILPEKLYYMLENKGRIIITVPSDFVDKIIVVLKFLRILDGMSDEQHYGFKQKDVKNLFKMPRYKLIKHKKFQLGLNNLYVFEKQ